MEWSCQGLSPPGRFGAEPWLVHLFADRTSSQSREWGIHKLLLDFLVTANAPSDRGTGGSPNSEGGGCLHLNEHMEDQFHHG